MIDLGLTSLGFIGRRNYIHSTDVFNLFVALMRARLGDAAEPRMVESYKFHRETRRNGRCILLGPKEKAWPALAAPAAEIVFVDRARVARCLALYDDGPDAIERRPDPLIQIREVTCEREFAGTVAVLGTAGIEQHFATLVEANKAIHESTITRQGHKPDAAIRFVYIEDLAMRAPGGDYRIKISHLGVRSVRRKIYTLNELRWGQETPARICFCYEPES